MEKSKRVPLGCIAIAIALIVTMHVMQSPRPDMRMAHVDPAIYKEMHKDTRSPPRSFLE